MTTIGIFAQLRALEAVRARLAAIPVCSCDAATVHAIVAGMADLTTAITTINDALVIDRQRELYAEKPYLLALHMGGATVAPEILS